MAEEFVGLRVRVQFRATRAPDDQTIEGRVSSVEGRKLYLTDAYYPDLDEHVPIKIIYGEDIKDLEVLPSREPQAEHHRGIGLVRTASAEATQDTTQRGMDDATAAVDDPSLLGFMLFVTGIHPKLTEGEVAALFKEYGKVEECNILRDPHTKESRGFGFVDMDTRDAAKAAREGLHGRVHEGRTLCIETARRSKPRDPTSTYKYFGTQEVPESVKENKSPSKGPVPQALSSGTHSPLAPPESSKEVDTVTGKGILPQFLHGNRNPDPPEPHRPGRRSHGNRRLWEQMPQQAEDSSPEMAKSVLRPAQNQPQASKGQCYPTTKTRPKAGPSLDRINNSSHAHGAERNLESPSRARNRAEKAKQTKLAREAAQSHDLEGEYPTDHPEYKEFDFAENLSKFDKKAVFNQLKADDDTAEGDWLVSHNSAKQPGTMNGTKLRPFENILSPAENFDTTNNEKMQQASVPKVPALPVIASAPTSSPSQHVSRNGSLGRDATRDADAERAPKRDTLDAGRLLTRPVFRISRTGDICPSGKPAIPRMAEAFAVETLHLNEDMFDENSGRAIAEVAMSMLDPDGCRFSVSSHNASPVVVVLLTKMIAASKGLAAARHLRERGITVIVTSALNLDDVGYDRDGMRRFATQFERFDGKVEAWEDTAHHLRSLPAPPELIIDAMSGRSNVLQRLLDRKSSQKIIDAILRVVAWANQSRAACLAVDCPLGVDPTAGSVRIVDGEPAEIRAKTVVCCGIPVSGILAASQQRRRDVSSAEWVVYVCDIGLNQALRRCHETPHERQGRFAPVPFGSSWVQRLDFDAGDDLDLVSDSD